MKLFSNFGRSDNVRGNCCDSAVCVSKSIHAGFWVALSAAIIVMTTSIPTYAYENATPDCGSDNFAVGALLPPSDCVYPEVFVEVLQYGDEYPVMWGGSTLTLIYKDDDKAVALTAAHVVRELRNSVNKGVYISLSPQGTTPFEASISPDNLLRKIRPNNIVQDLLPVVAVRANPLFLSPTFDYDVGVFFLDMHNEKVKSLLEGIEPVKLPPKANFLDDFSIKEIKALPLEVAGYSGKVADIYGANPPDQTAASWTRIVPSQGNRQYGAVKVVTVSNNWLHAESKILKNQTITCFGDSGSSMIMNLDGERITLAVMSDFTGTCSQSSYNRYARTDIPGTYNFLQCAVDPNKSIQESLDCIDGL